jgi:hypothetical protein|tara:strand:+ start:202 stop:732 length:531 start_codon:yes stop_codon:yes gene_type:complete
MKQISNIKLGFNKKAEVTVIADVEMKGKEDIDSLFLCFFTILTPPLRLSVITTGCLNQHLSTILGIPESSILEMMESNGEMYGSMIQQNTEILLEKGEEQNKILLSSAEQAQSASAILTSMLKNGYYIQKTRYHFPNSEMQKREQKVDISSLKEPFKAMLEICKRWDDKQLHEALE